jgi:ribosomal protein S18 acetylase RimI-like enzyme
MMKTQFQIKRVTNADDTVQHQLADVLIDCVTQGASIGFMHPLSRERALAFWQRIAKAVENNERILLVAIDPENKIVGTVQVITDQPDNQPHRADIAKLQVHSSARNQGLGEALMHAAETHARDAGKTVLVLDTVKDSPASRLYARLGWQVVGDIPGYALWPNGDLCTTTYFYKNLSQTP